MPDAGVVAPDEHKRKRDATEPPGEEGGAPPKRVADSLRENGYRSQLIAADPLLPPTVAAAALSHNHFEGAPPADAPRTSCRARASDIVFIPPRWRHAVASAGEEVAAVSFFYGR